jgi:hypothetical protein
VASGLRRGALVAVALVVGAWLVLSLRAVDLEAKFGPAAEQAPIRGELTTAELRATQDALRRARRFNADQEPLINEGLLLHGVGRVSEAVPLARRAVENEPENYQAWFLMYLVTQQDGKGHHEAYRRLRALNPWVADAIR